MYYIAFHVPDDQMHLHEFNMHCHAFVLDLQVCYNTRLFKYCIAGKFRDMKISQIWAIGNFANFGTEDILSSDHFWLRYCHFCVFLCFFVL